MTNHNLLYLKAVDIAERCFLKEVLLWRAFRRLPVFIPGERGDARFSYDNDEYDPFFDDYPISPGECDFAGLPISPEHEYLASDEYFSSVSFYDSILSRDELFSDERRKLVAERERAVEHEKDVAAWKNEDEDFIDYFKALVYMGLREGVIETTGIRVAGDSRDQADEWISRNKISLGDAEHELIPRTFWKQSGIDWECSAAIGKDGHYCWISVDTEQMFEIYPPPLTEPIGSLIPIGDQFIATASHSPLAPATNRGRPSLPWEKFHVEVARLVLDGELPAKKEAAIEYFIQWFGRSLGREVGRSSIASKLKPYYDRFQAAKKSSG